MSLNFAAARNSNGPILSLEKVSKSYPGVVTVTALKDISLKIENRAFAALIGPSGSGKTTLLNIASGLDRATEGSIVFDGQEIANASERDLSEMRLKSIGFVFQAYNLFPSLTVLENVEYSSIIRGDDVKKARTRALFALEQVGLFEKASFRPSQLSGGQQQRVAVARAFASEPKVIFADEPTANLDSKNAIALIDLFEEMNRVHGLTFVFSTHDQRLVDRVKTKVFMRDGSIIEGH